MDTPSTPKVKDKIILFKSSLEQFILELVATLGLALVANLGEVTHRRYKGREPRLDPAIDPDLVYNPGDLTCILSVPPGDGEEPVEETGAETQEIRLNRKARRALGKAGLAPTVGVVCKSTATSYTTRLEVETGELDEKGRPVKVEKEFTSTTVNGWRIRRLQALPLGPLHLVLFLVVRQFAFPPEAEGGKPRYRYEQVAGLTVPYARTTDDLARDIEHVCAVSASGWKAYSVLSGYVDISLSTLVRTVRNFDLRTDYSLYTRIGIDEFAVSKGRRYMRT